MITIDVLNEATDYADSNIQAMMAAFATQWNNDLAPIWGLDDAQFNFLGKNQPHDSSWWVVFLDNSDQADALAYHDLTNAGLPISKIFVQTLLQDKASVSVGATHEICEMAVDPWLTAAMQDPHGTFWANEVADPVEDDSIAYKIGEVLVTNFIYPAWYAPQHVSGRLDKMNKCTKPFQVLEGGYAQKFNPHRGWEMVNPPMGRSSRKVAAHEVKGSRHERRKRGHDHWQKSNHQF